jgi:hypothetical protein
MSFVADELSGAWNSIGQWPSEAFVTPSALANVIAGVQRELASEFSGATANVTSQQQGAGFAPQLDPTQLGSPTPTVDESQTVGGVLRPPK